ncbi:MAG TPA: GNAT family N-acetyltransferase [Rhodocyclaceae bacterium]|jgi:hypothetical protein
MKSAKFKRIDLQTLRIEGEALFAPHYAEVGQKDMGDINPDWAFWADLEAVGKAWIIGIYADDRLVGYSGFIVGPHAHYKHRLVAKNDVIFLLPEYRQGSLGLKLIGYSERALGAMGCYKVYWRAKRGSVLADLLTALCGEAPEVCFERRLK